MESIGQVAWDRGQIVIYQDHIEVNLDDPYYNGLLSLVDVAALWILLAKMQTLPVTPRIILLEAIESDVAHALHELTYFEGRQKQDDVIGILRKQRERIQALIRAEKL